MFSLSQPDLLANKMRRFILSAHISSETSKSTTFRWAPFPIETENASIIVPSPSGSNLLAVKNSENVSPTRFEIWCSSQLEKEFCVPQSVHGSVFTDDW